MDIQKANDIVSKGFKYKVESNGLWKVLNTEQRYFYGDCEDYGFTLLWVICDKNLKTFINAILSGKAKMWFCDTSFGKHNILQYEDLFCDNVEKKWKTRNYYENLNYKFRYTHSPYLILYRLAFTTIFNL